MICQSELWFHLMTFWYLLIFLYRIFIGGTHIDISKSLRNLYIYSVICPVHIFFFCNFSWALAKKDSYSVDLCLSVYLIYQVDILLHLHNCTDKWKQKNIFENLSKKSVYTTVSNNTSEVPPTFIISYVCMFVLFFISAALIYPFKIFMLFLVLLLVYYQHVFLEIFFGFFLIDEISSQFVKEKQLFSCKIIFWSCCVP